MFTHAVDICVAGCYSIVLFLNLVDWQHKEKMVLSKAPYFFDQLCI